MRRWFITLTLLANVLLSALVLVLLLNGNAWGEPTRLSATEADLLVIVAAIALVLTLVLAPLLGISFWSRDRSTRRLEERLARTPIPAHPDRAPAQGDEGHQSDDTSE
jgi:hypothetical protein